MGTMVMLTRGWARLLVLVGLGLEMFGLAPSALSGDDEPAEIAAAVTPLKPVPRFYPPTFPALAGITVTNAATGAVLNTAA
jgi:hypothetical protein